MPFQQERKQSLHDELTKEHIVPAVDLPSVKAPKVPQAQVNPQTAQQSDNSPQLLSIIAHDNPIYISDKDPEEKQKRDDLIAKGMKAFKEEANPALTEKMKQLQALAYAMRNEEDGLGIRYVRHDNSTKPKTAEEVYAAKEGDCDELSRLYVVLAKEQFGITNISQFYVVFRNEKTGENEGHAALFYIEGEAVYIDPAFEKAYVIHTKFKNIEEAIQDPEFRKDLEKYQFEARGRVDTWKVAEIQNINGQNSVEAIYCFEMGNYFSNSNNWQNISKYMSAAIEGGVQQFIAYLALGEAELNLGNYDAAIKSLKAAKIMNNNNADCHAFLGLSYMREKKPEYKLAVEEFREQLKLEPNDRDGKQNLAAACLEVGNQLMKAEEYKKALESYEEAEQALRSILSSSTEKDRIEIENVLGLLKNVKTEARKKLKE